MNTRSLPGQSASLCEKYRPLKIADFIGLAKPKLILQKLIARPYGQALLFEGKSGSGKTAMALAFAAAIPAQVHLLPANECTRDNVVKLWMNCQGKPGAGFSMHLILVDQADIRALHPALNGEVFRATDRVAAYDLDTFRINGIVLPIIVALRLNR